MRLVALLVGLLVSTLALADTVTLTWTNPTTYTDGSVLATSAITATRLEWGSCTTATPPAFNVKQGEWTNSGNGTQSVSPNLLAGTYCFRAFSRATVTANCPTPCESVASNAATKTINQAPSAPSMLSAIMSSPIAYTIVTTDDQVIATSVGTVKVGAVCDPSMFVKTKSIPSRPIDSKVLSHVWLKDVDLLPSVSGEGLVVFADCSVS